MTTDAGASHISSRDNPLLKDLRKLAQDPGAYRKLGRIWLEGDHLCRAALARGVTVDFLGELPTDRGFDVFAGPEAAAGQRPAPGIGFAPALPEQDLE